MGKKFSKSSFQSNSSPSNSRKKLTLFRFSNRNLNKMSSTNDNNNNDDDRREETKKEELFKYVDGRRYHNNPNLIYHLPNDDTEIDRLQLQHYLTRYVWQSNYSAPVHVLLKNGGEDIRVL